MSKSATYIGINNRNDAEHFRLVQALAVATGISKKAALKACIEAGVLMFTEAKLKQREEADAADNRTEVPEVPVAAESAAGGVE